MFIVRRLKRVVRPIKGVNSHFGVALSKFLDSRCLRFAVLSKKQILFFDNSNMKKNLLQNWHGLNF